MRSPGSSPKRSRTWSGRRKRVGASGCADVGASTGCWEVFDAADVVADKHFVLECSNLARKLVTGGLVSTSIDQDPDMEADKVVEEVPKLFRPQTFFTRFLSLGMLFI